MEYGIQRRSVYLTPPTPDELLWIFDLFDTDEVWQLFGMPGPAKMKVIRAYRSGNLVVGVFKRVPEKRKLGFVVMFPPSEAFDFWEFSFAIPQVEDRDGFSAVTATDTMLHYMFDHLSIDALGWRVREDNLACAAVVKRLGYEPYDSWFVDGHNYTFFRLDREGWARRVGRISRSDKRNPPIHEGTFATLDGPTFEPIEPDED